MTILDHWTARLGAARRGLNRPGELDWTACLALQREAQSAASRAAAGGGERRLGAPGPGGGRRRNGVTGVLQVHPVAIVQS